MWWDLEHDSNSWKSQRGLVFSLTYTPQLWNVVMLEWNLQLIKTFWSFQNYLFQYRSSSQWKYPNSLRRAKSGWYFYSPDMFVSILPVSSLWLFPGERNRYCVLVAAKPAQKEYFQASLETANLIIPLVV